MDRYEKIEWLENLLYIHYKVQYYDHKAYSNISHNKNAYYT